MELSEPGEYKTIKPPEIGYNNEDCTSLDQMLLTKSMPATPVSISMNNNEVNDNISEMFCNNIAFQEMER